MSEKELKKQKRKERKQKVKDFLAVKRNKALVKLGFYFLFFLIIILYIRFASRKTTYVPSPSLPDTITTSISNINIDNYEFDINYQINDEIYHIKGQKYGDKYSFTYNDALYYYDKDLYMIGDEKILIEPNDMSYLLMLDAKKIYNFLYNATYNYRQEDANHNITINSFISISDFSKLLGKQEEGNAKITFDTHEKNDVLTSIDIDLSNYFKSDLITSFKVNIIYSNLNQTHDFVY